MKFLGCQLPITACLKANKWCIEAQKDVMSGVFHSKFPTLSSSNSTNCLSQVMKSRVLGFIFGILQADLFSNVSSCYFSLYCISFPNL